jgi:flagellar hook-associated protein 1 FlgK
VELNKQINKVENIPHQHANDLRDERDKLELELAKMVNISVYKGNVDINGKRMQTDAGNAYNINIAGHNIVDGVTFHPLELAPANDESPFRAVYITDHNMDRVDITDKLRGGKVGAIIDLRGDGYDTKSGKAKHSKLQNYMDKLDALAKGFIQKANSIYASAAQPGIVTNDLADISKESRLSEIADLKQGTFEAVVYDSEGNVVARRPITIDDSTTFDDANDAASIVAQLNANRDDNGDNDGTNDLDDLFETTFIDNGDGTSVLSIQPKSGMEGYRIAIEDNGTNFAGWSGVNRLFEGSSAKDMRVRADLLANPSSLQASKANVTGSADLADAMINMQYEKVTFTNPDNSKTEQTVEEFYRYTTAGIAEDTRNASRSKDAAELLNKTVTEQMQSVSGVDMDEELMNLMKYQTAYQASAKIISTVDQMLNTLLGIKQ